MPMNRTHTVVIIEDELILAQALAELAEESGIRVLGMAATEADAVDMVLRLQPGVVLMDIKLAAQGSGISAARLIRRHSRVPIVFCTSYADTDGVEESVLGFGNTAMIGKPFDNEQLSALLFQAIAGSASPSGGPTGSATAL
jgi:DNA-binding NarL/FixJ family response regulator